MVDGHERVCNGAALCGPEGPMGSILTRKVITTDTRLSCWGGIHKARLFSAGAKSLRRLTFITHMEFSAVFLCFSSVSPGTSCPGEDGQYDGGGVYKLSRRFTFTMGTHALQLFPLLECDARARNSEHWCVPVVTRHASVQGLGSASRDCGKDLGLMWSGVRSGCGREGT